MSEDVKPLKDGFVKDEIKTQTVNVSGRKFDISEQLWTTIFKNIPEYERLKLKKSGDDVFVERHAGAFETVLYYYQSGCLHMPSTLCPSSYKEELEFWGVKPSRMSKCCFQKYVSYFDDESALLIMEEDQLGRQREKSNLIQNIKNGGWCGLQSKVWLMLEEPFFNLAAKIYFVISAILVIGSILVLVLGTHSEFQRSLKVHEWKSYFGNEWDTYKHLVIPEPEPETEPESEPETTPESETTPEPEATTEPYALPENAYARFDVLEYVEYVCVAIFSVDVLVRFFFCPFKKKLLLSFLYWVDVFALAVMYVRYVVEVTNPREKYQASILDILHCLQIVRVFRLFRLVKNFIGFRILIFAFKASFLEMLLMSFFLLTATLLFSTFAYFSGDASFPSIPDAFWWAIVTMTTVGYGDIVPVQALAKTIGVFCALSGVFLIAIIIPIFVNNFLLFYAYSKVWGREEDEKWITNGKNVKSTQVQAIRCG